MSLTPKLANVAANAAADAVLPLLNGGYLRLYSGSQPVTPDTPITTQTVLAELRWNATAFAAASAGVAAANAITQDSAAPATGTATWFRALKSDGITAIFDGSVGIKDSKVKSDSNLMLSSVAISAGTIVQVASFSYVQSKTG